MTPEERALELVDLIYRAVPDREAWGPVAKSFSDLFGGAAVTLVIQTAGVQRPSSAFHVGLDPELSRFAQGEGRAGLDWLNVPDLGKRFIRLSEFERQDNLEETEFAQRFLIPQGLAIEPAVFHITAPEEAVLSSGIAVYRLKDGPRITEEQLGIADRLVPHLKRAVAIHGRLENVEHQQGALSEVIDRISTGVVILDGRTRPIVVNRMANRILSAADGLAIDDHGPRGIDRETTATLRAMIDTAVNPLPGRELAGGGFMALPRGSGGRSYPILITPVLGRDQHSTIADAAVVLFVSDPDFRELSFSGILSDVYGLTPAESELTQLLIQGRTLEQAAKARKVTLNTARSQLKQVFAKTETSRQGELLKLMLGGVALLDRDADLDAPTDL